MGNNVIILGAGFSFDAGIPLLSGFVDTMWEIAVRKTFKGQKLSEGDIKIFQDAADVRSHLDSYHGRANFDDRNIEDILSILSFGAIAGSSKARAQQEAMNRAISRTIELTCKVTHPGIPGENDGWSITSNSAQYQSFWTNLFAWKLSGNELPTIVTLNYDLVLERSLFQVLINKTYNQGNTPLRNFRIKYYFPEINDEILAVKGCNYDTLRNSEPGTVIRRTGAQGSDALTEIEILKLHGSVNFPKKKTEGLHNLEQSLSNPEILPPIFNKISASTPTDMWRVALERISKAQNIIIVGYSLPRTDIYMQYFLKAAIGPNVDLNRIYVFDPTLYRNNSEEAEMRSRYESCFAQQLRSRITFRPNFKIGIGDELLGTTKHFLALLGQDPANLLF
jgi:hypothetical protein